MTKNVNGHLDEILHRKRGRPSFLGPSVAVDLRVPVDLYADVATEAAERGVKIGPRIREILEAHFKRRKGKR